MLAATEGSVFEIRMDEYARRTALANRGADKVLHGIAHLAVAALAFPRPDDLGDDSYVGRVSVELVDGAVREACRVLNERAAGPADPESDDLPPVRDRISLPALMREEVRGGGLTTTG